MSENLIWLVEASWTGEHEMQAVGWRATEDEAWKLAREVITVMYGHETQKQSGGPVEGYLHEKTRGGVVGNNLAVAIIEMDHNREANAMKWFHRLKKQEDEDHA